MSIREFHERLQAKVGQPQGDPRFEPLRALTEVANPDALRPREDSRACWSPWFQ